MEAEDVRGRSVVGDEVGLVEARRVGTTCSVGAGAVATCKAEARPRNSASAVAAGRSCLNQTPRCKSSRSYTSRRPGDASPSFIVRLATPAGGSAVFTNDEVSAG